MNNREMRVCWILGIVFILLALMAIVVWKVTASDEWLLPGWSEYWVNGDAEEIDGVGLVWTVCTGEGGRCDTRVWAVCLEPEKVNPTNGSRYTWKNGIFVSVDGRQNLGVYQVVRVLWGTWLPNVGK